VPHGSLDQKSAWKRFGGLNRVEAFQRFIENPICYQEDFMWMGSKAFAYYFPVIERFLIEFELGTDNDDAQAWILGCDIAMQFKSTKADCLKGLVPRILDLARWVTANVHRFSYDEHEHHRIANKWARLKKLLRE